MVHLRFMSAVKDSNNTHQPVAYANAALKINRLQVLTISLQLTPKMLYIY